MNILETYYTYAKLSQAAYIDLSPAKLGINSPLNATIITQAAKNQERVSLALAENIFGVGAANTNPSDTWTMLSPYYKTGSWYGSSTGHSDPTSGFAGMLLSNANYGKVLAIAGTEPTNGASQFVYDLLFSDIGQIGLLGAAFNQLVSLFNYVQELKEPAGATDVLRLEVLTGDAALLTGHSVLSSTGTYYALKVHNDGQGKGLIAAGEKITVTGHSLGGHLAAMAARLFPNLISDAYTYNAPGFDPVSADFAALLVGQWKKSLGLVLGAVGNVALQLTGEFVSLAGNYLSSPPAASFNSATIHTLESEDIDGFPDVNIVPSVITGAQAFGYETMIATERNSHMIEPLMDSLALHALIYRMNDTLVASGNVQRLFENASNTETLVAANDAEGRLVA